MSHEKLSFLRAILKPLSLSEESIERVIEFISDLLFEKNEASSSKVEYPYHLCEAFITPAELNFFFNLKAMLGESAQIFIKVKLSDLFYAKTGDHSKNRSYMNRIDRKHVDFLLCDSKTLTPILGIELDDKSHQRADRQERDDFVNRVFEAAKLPLIHFSVQRSYSQSELMSKLSINISNSHTSSKEAEKTQISSPPCPKCGSIMILRTAKQGANQGGKFWGCSMFPECRGVISIENI